MLLEPGFFAALQRAFDQVPDLFCATAQIRFPPGVRREETGKAVMAQAAPDDFPVRCDEPLPGEDLAATCSTAAAAARSTTPPNCARWAVWTRPTIPPTWKISTSAIAPGSAAGPPCT